MSGRVPSGRALTVPVEPASSLAPSGFDPSRGLRLLVCGGRDFNDQRKVCHVLDRIELEHGVATIIHGGASGADTLAHRWAIDDTHHGVVAVEAYPADWRAHGRAAGPIRNQQMLARGRPELAVAFPGGRGTDDMVARVKRAGVRLIDLRDRDRSGEADETQRGSAEGKSPDPKGIAQ